MPSNAASTRAMPYCELALTSTLMVPVVPETWAANARLELATLMTLRTSV